MEVETTERCESDRIAVTGIVKNAPAAPILTASGNTVLCPGESVLLIAENVCQDCVVHWSNGESGTSITVSIPGTYTATVSDPLNNTCGDSPASNALSVTTNTVPTAPIISASGSTELCTGESVLLTAENVCPDCSVQWSTAETGPSITVSTEGVYAAILSNVCGESPISNVLSVVVKTVPAPAVITASGSIALCPGESVVLTAENVCPDCSVQWSTAETGPSITVSTEGVYAAIISNVCGESPVSNIISVVVNTVPSSAVVTASGPTALCPGESVVLTAENVCPDCSVQWSTGETGPSITVSTEGFYAAYS
jgi:hypothetical protein